MRVGCRGRYEQVSYVVLERHGGYDGVERRGIVRLQCGIMAGESTCVFIRAIIAIIAIMVVVMITAMVITAMVIIITILIATFTSRTTSIITFTAIASIKHVELYNINPEVRKGLSRCPSEGMTSSIRAPVPVRFGSRSDRGYDRHVHAWRVGVVPRSGIARAVAYRTADKHAVDGLVVPVAERLTFAGFVYDFFGSGS